MLRDAQAGRLGCSGAELAANRIRRIRLRVEALVLRETARKEDVDDALRRPLAFGAQCVQVAETETEQSNGPGRDRVASGQGGVCECGHWQRSLGGIACGPLIWWREATLLADKTEAK